MTGHIGTHGKHMVASGVGILALLALLGSNFPHALFWTLILACPVGMLGMMWFMHRSNGDSQDAHAKFARSRGATKLTGEELPASLVATQSRHHD